MESSSWPADGVLMGELGSRLAQVRLRRNITQAELAHEAGVSKRTVERLESGESVQLASLLRVLRVLGLAPRLDALLPPPQPSPMQQLRGKTREKIRARRPVVETPPQPWTWDDDT